jgi:ribose transport system permease protein
MIELKKCKRFLIKYFTQILLVVILCILCIVLSFKTPYFLTWVNIYNILDQTSMDIILALGMVFVMSAGGIDLSIGSTMALAAVIAAFAMQAGIPVPLSFLIGMSIGLAVGLANGFLIASMHLSPLIITLGFQSVARGLTLILTKSNAVFGFPAAFKMLGTGHIGPVNAPIIISLSMVVICTVLLNTTKWGYYTLAIGGNEEAVRRSGISVKKYSASIYIFCGIMAAVAGMITAARLNSADPLAGWMVEIDAISAVVLGGASLNGGKGSVIGTFLACIVLGVLDNGLVLLSFPSYYQKLICGLIIIIALIITELRNQKNKVFGR